MKILLIHHRPIFPIRCGLDKVVYNLIRTLAVKHEVTILFPIDQKGDIKSQLIGLSTLARVRAVSVKLNREKSYIKRKFGELGILLQTILLHKPPAIIRNYYPEVAQALRQEIQFHHYDLVQTTNLACASYLANIKNTKTSLILTDNSFQLYKDHIHHTKNYLKKLRGWFDYTAYLHYELNAVSQRGWSLYISQQDMQSMRNLCGESPKLRFLPLTVETDLSILNKSLPCEPEDNSLVFVGGLGPLFNRDAVLYFVRCIFPLILCEEPKTHFYVVGESPPVEIRSLANQNIIITGTVPDVKPYIHQASVYVAPVRFGGGLKTKIVEALSLGKAIVATTAGTSGLWDLGEETLQIKDDPYEFALTVVDLLRHPEKRRMLEKRSIELYQRSYTFEKVAPISLAVYDEIFNGAS